MTGNKLSIYRLLDIKPESSKILFLIIPVIYALWLIAIGKRLLQKQNKSDRVFSFFSSGTLLLFVLAMIPPALLKSLYVDLNTIGPRLLPIVLCLFACWFITIGMLARLTVKYERSKEDPETFYGLVDNLDYVKRFFLFFFWFMGIWYYQESANELDH